jgi:glucosamine-6-phosphate deaminase
MYGPSGVKVELFSDKRRLASAAARQAAQLVRAAIAERGRARIIAATGASQIEFLESFTSTPDIDWSRVELFHLDEYVGLPIEHPASFRRYLLERLIRRTGIPSCHLLDGQGDLERVIADAGRAITEAPIDVAFAGIGENGHLAFNDPPADFETSRPYLIVELDQACRQQQVGEGWFPSIEAVPTRAISMSVRQLLAAREILCIVPDARKAAAVRRTLTGAITPAVPASILRTHPRVTLFLDQPAASLLDHASLPGVA